MGELVATMAWLAAMRAPFSVCTSTPCDEASMRTTGLLANSLPPLSMIARVTACRYFRGWNVAWRG